MNAKTISFSIITLVFLGLTYSANITFATSGACSNHGGVNCSIGANFDGKVTCNDGWTNSSVYFSDVDECKVSCTPPSGSGCKTENDYGAMQSRLLSSGGYLGNSASQSGTLSQCRNEINTYQASLETYNSCLNNSNGSAGRDYSVMNINSYVQSKMQEFCTTNYGENVYYDSADKNCKCSSGYLFDKSNNKCSVEIDVRNASCKRLYGQYSISTPNQPSNCTCINGYSFDSNDQCVSQRDIDEKIQADIKASYIADINKKDQDCKASQGQESVFDQSTNTCACYVGFVLNNNQCIKVVVENKVVVKVSKPKEKIKVKTDILPKAEIVSSSTLATSSTVEIQKNIEVPKIKQSFTQKIKNWFINLFK